MINLSSDYANLGPEFASNALPKTPTAPELIHWNQSLADALSLPSASTKTKAAFFSGAGPYQEVSPVAMAYAGHQFGQFVPRLGDGRAHLLGEWSDPQGLLWDVHLKGSGRTPYSRGGDGLAWLGPVLREYLISEAMHALGIPTTRALAMCSTGDTVFRDAPRPGAVITRISKSFVRVGTFEYFAARQDRASLQKLFEFTAKRLGYNEEDPIEFFKEVTARQCALILAWLNVGFVHGVMNTDNTSLSGETIDYGPCAFLDDYHPQRRFSSIDHMGRYNYMAQKSIIFWNLANLGSALSALTQDPEAAAQKLSEILMHQAQQMQNDVAHLFARKLGLEQTDAADCQLGQKFLDILQEAQADFTLSFSALRHDIELSNPAITAHPDYADFKKRLDQRWATQQADPDKIMAGQNPLRIPRNHLVEAAISAATEDNFIPFERLLKDLKTPFGATWDSAYGPPLGEHPPFVTYCGT